MAFRPLNPTENLLGSIIRPGSTMFDRLREEERMMETAPPDLREIQGLPNRRTMTVAEISRPKVDVGRPAWSTTRWSNISKVDPRLRDIMEKAAVQFAKENPGYSVVGISGKKSRKSGTKQHPMGWAVDVDIVDPTGKHLKNYQSAKNFRTYEKFGQIARAYQKQFHPELTRDFRAGMYFSGKWHHDLMHFDINPEKHGAMKYGSWEDGLTPDGRKALPGAESIGMNAFPPAPSGPTGWPTPPEKGPGIYGALNPATLAEQYGLANTRYRQPVAATPLDQFRPALTRPQFGPPAPPQSQTPARPSPGGAVAPASPSTAPLGGWPSMARPDLSGGTYSLEGAPGLDAPMSPSMPESSIVGPQTRDVLGAGAVTPGMYGETPAVAAAPAAPAPTAPAVPAPTAPALTAPAMSAYPDEGRFSMKKGLTPAQMEQMGLTPPAPALPAPTKVKTQKVDAVQPAEQVTTTRVKTTPAPAIVAGQPPPAKPGGLIGALENLAAPLTERLAAPFHTLANIAGPVPNPKSFDYGTGAQAIGDALSGATQSKPGAVSYSRSTPGYSIKSLGNGMVEKTNQYGHKSYEHVGGLGTPGSGILSGQPTTGGLLSNFGMPGLGATAGGLLSGKNLGGFAGSLLGGAVAGPFGALAGGWLGNKLGSNLGGTGFGNTANVGPNAFGYAGPWGAGTAPASSGGLFGGFGNALGGGGLFGGFGGSTSTGGGKRSGTSGGGRGSMSAGSGGMSKSTRY